MDVFVGSQDHASMRSHQLPIQFCVLQFNFHNSSRTAHIAQSIDCEMRVRVCARASEKWQNATRTLSAHSDGFNDDFVRFLLLSLLPVPWLCAATMVLRWQERSAIANWQDSCTFEKTHVKWGLGCVSVETIALYFMYAGLSVESPALRRHVGFETCSFSRAYTIEMEIKLHTIIINIYCDTKNWTKRNEMAKNRQEKEQDGDRLDQQKNSSPMDKEKSEKWKRRKYIKWSRARCHLVRVILEFISGDSVLSHFIRHSLCLCLCVVGLLQRMNGSQMRIFANIHSENTKKANPAKAYCRM